MANLPESSTFDSGVYQIETTDPVIGGPSGVTNTPLKNLANRTRYLKDQVDAVKADYVNAAGVNAQIAAAAAPLSHVGATGNAHGLATTSAAGFMAPEDKVRLNGFRPGQVGFFARATAPTGWLKCNGAAISRSVYADLFAEIGTAFGAGDGVTTFNLPDARGEFLRGWDDSRGVDSGRAFGSAQKGTIYCYDVNGDGVWVTSALTQSGAASQGLVGADPYNTADYPSVTITGVSPQTSETIPGSAVTQSYSGVMRPRNVAFLTCIKF